MILFLTCFVLLVALAGFAYAEGGDINNSLKNETNVDINESVIVTLNESLIVTLNETEIVNETVESNETKVDVVVEDIEIDDLTIEDVDAIENKDSISDKVFSYVGNVVNRINEIHKNLFYIILIILGVLLLFVYSIFFDYSSSDACFAKAASLHRKGEKAHVNGNYKKAEKLYNKSYLFRERGVALVSRED